MSNEETEETPTNKQLQDKIRQINEAKGSTFSVSGDKATLTATLAEAEAYEPEGTGDGDETVLPSGGEVLQSDTEQQGAEGDLKVQPDGATTKDPDLDVADGNDTDPIDEGGPLVDPSDSAKDPVVDHMAGLGGALAMGEMTGPDGQPLPQTKPEPADVAGPSGGGGDGVDNSAIARAASREADARYLERGELPNGNDDANVDRPTLEDEAPLQYSEASLPDRTREEIVAWAERNPEATVIPPSLLPPAFRDGTIATPGLPEL